jgi:flagellar biosynthesis GTPase FlhF
MCCPRCKTITEVPGEGIFVSKPELIPQPLDVELIAHPIAVPAQPVAVPTPIVVVTASPPPVANQFDYPTGEPSLVRREYVHREKGSFASAFGGTFGGCLGLMAAAALLLIIAIGVFAYLAYRAEEHRAAEAAALADAERKERIAQAKAAERRKIADDEAERKARAEAERRAEASAKAAREAEAERIAEAKAAEEKRIADALAMKKARDAAEKRAKQKKDEDRAVANLNYAKKLVENGDLEKAKERLSWIVKEFPDTEAAKEAKQFLEKQGK